MSLRKHFLLSGAKRRTTASLAFSLVEVVIALGVTSFAVLALIGTLPTGIKSVQDSSNESARANILQQIRAGLQEVNFGTTGNTISNLPSVTRYYDNNGDLLPSSTGAYYMATFALTNAYMPDATAPQAIQTTAAQSVQVILSYPYAAALANRTLRTNYLFVAEQKNY